MTLTRKQRIEAYTYALFCALEYKFLGARYPGCPEEGVCDNLDQWERDSGFSRIPIEEYPEFLQQRPRNKRMGYWWDKQRHRISALCRAIEQCEKVKHEK